MAEDGFKTPVAVVGLGLLGTSLAMALKAKKIPVTGWTRRREIRNWAVAQQIITATADDVESVLGQAAITVICLPIPEIIAFVRDHAGAWRPGAVVTDIGSVKEVIVTAGEAELVPRGVHFVGSHPMAGTEKSGPEHAFPELYDNAEVFVTPTKQTDPAAVAAVRQLWELIGTSVVAIDPATHDNLVAHTSHISHLLALSLTEAVLDCREELRPLRYSGCATGFRDTSRIASSSPKMWR
ncbi:MAG: prephenate dehydrogenase/arogenate dehydrogenase family protein, partial [Victivallales bacterium]|nr:prephenate dehydrogenase/arogenate dehydrogenase family protein [Victivallales bacterium]